MNKAHFQDISVHINSLLESAEREVKIAVAWYTNKFLYRAVENLLEAEKKATIIISDSPHNFGPLDFPALVRKGADVRVYVTQAGRFMHNKFCIVDDQRGITGSFNWSYSAENNFENVLEFEGNTVKQFNWLFGKLYEKSVLFHEAGGKKEEVLTEEAKEDYRMLQLEQEFEDRVQASLKDGLALRIKINFDNLYKKIDRYGAVGAARMLVSSQDGMNLQAGLLELARKSRLDLSFEALVLLPQFRPLFPPEVIQFAERRLELAKIEAQLPSLGRPGRGHL
jgi:phosphatidylserine/phosphatidylglycerophosphate/cardiolipin synthase-like enzyme